jgi:capsular polysaccharide biosynthesis protein
VTLESAERARAHLLRDALRRRWLLVVGSLLVGGLLGAGLVAHGRPHYTSTSSVFLQPIAGNALSPDATVNGQQVTVAMETEAGLVESPDVVQRVRKVLRLPADELRADVAATVPSNTKIVQIQFTASTARAARAGAQAFAAAFLDFRQSLAADAENRQIDKLHAQVVEANSSLRSLAKATGASAAARRQVLVSRLATLQASIGQLAATDVNPGVISSPARLPSAPAGIPADYLVAVLILVGLIVGVVAAVGIEASDDRVRRSEGLPVAGLPVLSELEHRHAREHLLIDRDEPGAVVEAFRQLRVGLSATVPSAGSVCISHADVAGEVGTHVLNLAMVMTHAGSHITVVDATPDAAVTRLVADRLIGEVRSDAGAQLSIDGDRSITVTCVSRRAGQLAFVDEERLTRVLIRPSRAVDRVLVAAPSLMTSDGEVAALATDCLLLVVDQGRSRVRDIERFQLRARTLGVAICGVLSSPSARRRARRLAHARPEAHGAGAAKRRLRRLIGALRLGQATSEG